MSSGLNCLYVQIESSKWYWVLENHDAPKTSWDWKTNASCCGPFQTKDAAHTHLHRNNSNPGGAEIEPLGDEKTARDLSTDSVLARLIRFAVHPGSQRFF